MILAKSPAFPHTATSHVAEWTTVLRMAERQGAWRNLAANAIEPNPFYEFDYLASSARDIESADIRCIAIYRDASRHSELLGLFPLAKAAFSSGVYVPAFEFYRNPFICSTAPLIRQGDPVAVWRSFFEALRREQHQPRTVLARQLPVTRPVATSLGEALALEGLATAQISAFARAAVETEATSTAYRDGFSALRRKDIRRRLRRMAESGRSRTATLTSGPELAAAVEAFLTLEAAGWKGRAGTAMVLNPATARMARQVFCAPNAEADVLHLDGKPVAICLSLVSQAIKFTVKIAYDETCASFSPGAMLDVFMLDDLAQGGRLKRADSCADAGNAVEAVWLEREEIEWRAFSVDPMTPSSRLESLAATLRSVQRLKGWVKEQIGRR